MSKCQKRGGNHWGETRRRICVSPQREVGRRRQEHSRKLCDVSPSSCHNHVSESWKANHSSMIHHRTASCTSPRNLSQSPQTQHVPEGTLICAHPLPLLYSLSQLTGATIHPRPQVVPQTPPLDAGSAPSLHLLHNSYTCPILCVPIESALVLSGSFFFLKFHAGEDPDTRLG